MGFGFPALALAMRPLIPKRSQGGERIARTKASRPDVPNFFSKDTLHHNIAVGILHLTDRDSHH